jgi:hypothetical protein
LREFRGAKEEDERRLEFDLLGVNLWRHSGGSTTAVLNKIIKLYNMKEESILEEDIMVISDPSDMHRPSKMAKEQNCALCSTLEPHTKPKRTNTICKLCST